MCVGSSCVGGSPHPPAGITSTLLFSPDTSMSSISDHHTPWEPIREAWGSAFRIQAHLVAQLCHRSQQRLTGQSPPCHSCHCPLPGHTYLPGGLLHLWLPYPHRFGTGAGAQISASRPLPSVPLSTSQPLYTSTPQSPVGHDHFSI